MAFYTDILKFQVGYHAENYAYLHRDNVAVRLVKVDAGTDLSPPERQGSIYIDVGNIDALYVELQPGLVMPGPGRARAVFNQDYGQREFHVSDEGCTLILFGAPIPA